ncbi:MAG: hypothetical protein ACRDIB_08655 [Ardenticatenaceae bacterium]
MEGSAIEWGELVRWLLIISGTSLLLAAVMGVWVWQRVRHLRLPPEATFVEAMRLTPFSVVLFLDLLDLGLDVFSAPISWVVLSRLGLQQLRGATVLEALIPGTQAIPTMTTAWLLVRLFGPKLDEIPFLNDEVNRHARKRLEDIHLRHRS